MNPDTEPSRLVGFITAAITSTIGIFTITGVLSPEVAGGIVAALGAWVALGAEIVRGRVTPNSRVALTTDQAEKLEDAGVVMAPVVVDPVILPTELPAPE